MNPYIYVHINKCGGSSVKKALTGSYDHKHECIWCIRRGMEAIKFNRAFKFAVIRHPYSRLVSMYHYRIKTAQHGLTMSFQQWFDRVVIAKELPHYNNPLMFAPCWDWITDDGVAVDYVAKLETIQQDWPIICEHLGIMRSLPKLNDTEHDNPISYFDDKMKQQVKKIYSKDFKLYD